jgi:hypothetical protein
MRENLTSGLTRGAGASLPLLYLSSAWRRANSTPIDGVPPEYVNIDFAFFEIS